MKLEPSPADPSSALSVDEVVKIYQRWFRGAPRGFAVLVYQGEPARREFLNRLGGRIKTLRFVDLSRCKDAQTVIESMASALEASDSVVFFGFEEALAATPENARLLNFNRERLASFRARQLWIIGPIWRRALLTWAFDLYSWFLPNNTMGLPAIDQRPNDFREFETAKRLDPGPAPSQAARRSAASLLARFERTLKDRGEVSWDLLNGALKALQSAGAYPESTDLLVRALNLLEDVKRSGQAESPQALRELSIALGNVGDVQEDLGRRDEALASFQESLGIRRRLLDVYGESPQALRDLSVSLDNVGDVQRDFGRRDQALASHEESLGIRRRLVKTYGESPQALRDLSISLSKAGRAQLDSGRVDDALASYGESLGIRRRLLNAYGESPESLRGLSVSLDDIGHVQRDFGRRDEALTSYEESLGIRRRLLDVYGESPELLRDLSISLGNIGRVQRHFGGWDGALTSYEESLGICRRLLDVYGESPQALRDLSISLDNVGHVQRDFGRWHEALTSFEESLGICRRLLDVYGESPQALRDLSVSLDNIGDVLRDVVRRDEALASYEESLEISRSLLAIYGESPEALQDLEISLGRVGNMQENLGTDGALATYAESLGICRRLLDVYGESPQALRELALSSYSLARVVDVSSPSGRQALAEANHAIEHAIELYGELPDLVEVREWMQSTALCVVAPIGQSVRTRL